MVFLVCGGSYQEENIYFDIPYIFDEEMIEITCNDRLGKKVRVKCNPDDTVGDLKKLIAAQTGTRWDKIVLKKWYTTFKDHIQLQDCILYKISMKWKFIIN